MSIVSLMLVNVLVIIAATLLLWGLSLWLRDVSFVDSWWPVGMVGLSIISFVQSGSHGAHAIVLMGLCAIWGLRLGLYLFWRWRKHGADPRYTTMLEDARTRRGWPFPLAALLLVFLLQAPLQLIVALPVELGQLAADPKLHLLGLLGAGLALAGILIEATADWQLARFKGEAANRGKVMDQGLWRYTRHPNYFGEACLWWGLYLIAAESPIGRWSLPGPVIITLLLTKGSGAPTVEGRMKERGAEYLDYIRRTPSFIPWFPKSPGL